MGPHKGVVADDVHALGTDRVIQHDLDQLQCSWRVGTTGDGPVQVLAVNLEAEALQLRHGILEADLVAGKGVATDNVHKVHVRRASHGAELLCELKASASVPGLRRAVEENTPDPAVALPDALGHVVVDFESLGEATLGRTGAQAGEEMVSLDGIQYRLLVAVHCALPGRVKQQRELMSPALSHGGGQEIGLWGRFEVAPWRSRGQCRRRRQSI
mmetsp:Transcript_63238/g.137548  ORF Transcript_63238/g.137548 Transcript_63238/m.137548 type:complete len:214 (+) Transcript_63238:941-1582(+)